MKYIEFLGLPGAGKTTLAKETLAILRANQRKVLTKLEAREQVIRAMIRQRTGMLWRSIQVLAPILGYRMWNLLWEKHQAHFLIDFLCRYPELTRYIVEVTKQIEPPSAIPEKLFSATHLVHWILDPAMLYQASSEFLAEDAILVQEEGFCQQAYYLLAAFRTTKPGVDDLKRYFRQIPQPHLLILLSSDPEQCEARMQRRAKGVSSDILRYLSVNDRLDVLKDRLRLYEWIAAYFEEQQGQVVRLDNRDLRMSHQRLKDALAHV